MSLDSSRSRHTIAILARGIEEEDGPILSLEEEDGPILDPSSKVEPSVRGATSEVALLGSFSPELSHKKKTHRVESSMLEL